MSEEQKYTISTSHELRLDIVLYKSGQTTYTLKPTRDKPNVIWHDDRALRRRGVSNSDH